MVFKNRKIILLVVISLLFCQVSYGRDMYFGAMSDKPDKFKTIIDTYRANPAASETIKGKIKGGILPHHLLASWMMADFFEVLSSNTHPKRVIIIGPDHFVKGLSTVSIGLLPYKTPTGILDCDKNAAQQIRKTLLIPDDTEAFSGEHSIGNIVPFVKYYFPDSKIITIILQKDVPPIMQKQLIQELSRLLNQPDTIILLSIDFSHNHTPQEADKLDIITRKVILDYDYKNIEKADVDSHSGLEILMRTMEAIHAEDIRIRFHSNAAQLTGDYSRNDVTSYHTIFFTK